jgi:type IV pilus assembly protein PilM
MAKKVLSIVIGTENTKVCEISYKKNKNKGIHVNKSISFPTPENTIEDGFIKDMDTFGEELKSQLRKGKLKSDKVIFSIASSKIANREVVIPPVKESRIMDIIQTGATDYFPIDIKEYILSYIILEKKLSDRKDKKIRKKNDKKAAKLAKKLENKNKKAASNNKNPDYKIHALNQSPQLVDYPNKSSENNFFIEEMEEKAGIQNDIKNKVKKQIRLSVYAAPSSLVKNYYDFANLMNFTIVSIDYSGNSSYQMIKRQADYGINVFVQLNEKDTMISILQNNVLILQRTVGYGIKELTDAVIEHNFYKVKDEKEAMELLKNENLLTIQQESEVKPDSYLTRGEAAATSEFIHTTQDQTDMDNQEEAEAKRYIIDSLHLLTNSITRMLDYYKANHKNAEFDMIYLSGIGIRVKGIDQFFSQEIGIVNKKMEKLVTVSASKKAELYRTNPSEFMTCVGTVIQSVNFVPLELVKRKQRISSIIGAAFMIAVSITGAFLLSYTSYLDYQAAKLENTSVVKQLEAMPASTGIHEEYEKIQLELADLKTMDNLTKSQNEKINEVIKELENKLISGTIIHSMQFSETGITMSVTVADDNRGSNAIVAKMLLQLKSIEYFDQVDISGTSASQENGKTSVSFSISCTYSLD